MMIGKRQRGQAAMEFLMTYGWAILIMLVVIAVLFYLGVFNTSNLVPESCTLPAGFTCNEFEILSGGNIYLDVGQATGRTVNITSFNCSDNATAPVSNAAIGTRINITNGQHAIVTSATLNTRSCCAGGAGTSCKARILMNYTSVGSTLTRQVWGDIGGTVPT